MPQVTKGVSAGDALNLAFAWQWPVDLTKYDHPLTLTRHEREALSEVVHRPRFPVTFPPTLTRLLQPMSDVLQLSTSVRMRCHAKRVLLLEMHQRQRPLWAWTPEEWAEILGATWQSFAGRYPKMPLCRQHVLLVGYLLCGFTDFHLLGGFTRESLAHMVFGAQRMEATIGRVNEGVRLWGLVNLRDMSLRSAVYEALLLNQNPYLEELTYEQLLMMRERTETLALKRAVG